MSENNAYDKALERLKINQSKLKLAEEYTRADNIIRYLTNPLDEEIELSDRDKEKLQTLKEIHGFRMRFHRKSDIVNILIKAKNLKERQCYNLINECEYVFGSIEGVNKVYERNFLMEASRKNLEIAFAARDSKVISKAIREHYIVAGLGEVHIEMPDFAALEPNKYVISLPEHQLKFLTDMMKHGYVDLKDVVPHENITFNIPHEDVTDPNAE